MTIVEVLKYELGLARCRSHFTSCLRLLHPLQEQQRYSVPEEDIVVTPALDPSFAQAYIHVPSPVTRGDPFLYPSRSRRSKENKWCKWWH